MKLAQGVLPLLLVVHAAPAAADALTDLFPPETKVVLGIRVHNIAVSPLTKAVVEQAKTAAANWLNLIAPSGFDPLRDIDEVMIASGAQGANAPTLIVIRGHFDFNKLTEGANKYKEAALIGGDKPGDTVIALIDSSTAVAGEFALVRSAIDRRGAGVKFDMALNDRITSLRQRYDVWGLGERPQGFSAPLPQAKSLESIDRFQFGMQLNSGLDLGAELHARSPKDMEKLSESLQLISAILKGQQPSAGGSKFDLQVEGATMKLSVSIPEAELKRAIQTEIRPSTQTMPADFPALTVAAGEMAFAVPPPAAPIEETVVPEAPKPAPHPPSKPRESQVLDKEGNTVILKLPGKK